MSETTLYDSYQKIKGWDDEPFMSPTPGDIIFYDHYLSNLNLKGEKVVELGFGNGNFLGWARGQGATLYGTEVQQAAIDKALGHGVTVLPVDIGQSVTKLSGQVAAMVAMDVMEHLTLQQNEAVLTAAATMLKPGGLLLLRFPDGQSPLSLTLQYGDRTHITVMSMPIIVQMIVGLPLVVDYAGPPFRTITNGGVGKIARLMQNQLRRLADKLIRSIYGEIPMSINAMMVLRRI